MKKTSKNNISKSFVEKAVALAIVAVFIGSAFAPVVGTQISEEEITDDSVYSAVSFWQRFNDLFQGFFDGFQDNPFFSLIERLFSRGSSVSSEDSIDNDKKATFEDTYKDSDNNDLVMLNRDIGDPWWNSDWDFRRLITIDHTEIGDDLEIGRAHV